MSAMLPIHPELQAAKAHALPSSRWMLSILQTFLRAVNYLHRRRFSHVMASRRIPSSDGYRVSVLIIRPERPQPKLPLLVYYHGGAFVMEGAPAHTENAVRYAADANCVVVYVEYRLAPHHPFPAGFDDCYAGLQWALANAPALGVDATRVVIGGDSAGGNLAAAVTQRVRDEGRIPVRAQLLIYPAVDLLCTRPSMTAYKDVPPFKDLSHSGVAATYLGHEASRPLPKYTSPIDGELAGLPPTYLEVPEFDPLHDQGIDYAAKLRANGVAVELHEIAGGIHGLDVVAAGSGPAREVMNLRIDFLKRVFTTTPATN